MRNMINHNSNHKAVLLFVWVILFSTCTVLVNAALISGSIYDLSLQKESNTVVEINTVPKQLFVSKDGDYGFNVKPGNYTLYAHTSLSEATESVIVVTDDGNYTLDIILEDKLASLPDGTDLTESDIPVSSTNPSSRISPLNLVLIVVASIAVILVIILGYIYLRSKKHKSSKHDISTKQAESESEKPLDEYAHKVLKVIQKEKRTTQKDLRKEIPLSEAKISLIVADLENKGKIRKIKKGRGNILIFVKD